MSQSHSRGNDPINPFDDRDHLSDGQKEHVMSYDTITVTPVMLRIGSDIDGIELARPLTNRQVAATLRPRR
jgi:hypothetical protein